MEQPLTEPICHGLSPQGIGVVVQVPLERHTGVVRLILFLLHLITARISDNGLFLARLFPNDVVPAVLQFPCEFGDDGMQFNDAIFVLLASQFQAVVVVVAVVFSGCAVVAGGQGVDFVL